MTSPGDGGARSEFGLALRRWRDRVRPQDAGLPAGGRRRAPGLRREELAGLAGISADYVVRLEQGRAGHPSAQIVEALARALRLDDEERAHLHRLAGLAPPSAGSLPQRITPGVHRLLDRLSGTPVAVYDASWTLLLVNRPYAALMGDPAEWRGLERNGVWRHFAGPGSRARQSPEERDAFERAMVADLRTAAERYPADRGLGELIAELHSRSGRFADLWDSGAVGRHEAARKTIDHPEAGPITLDCDILAVSGPDLRIMLYTAEPGSRDAELLAAVTESGPVGARG
ncbi:helix-turn-helix transcriptional regulator [Phaeacidiphilus oryzae]|uniref:helix-turn-helix transcriptional regulator n=1 Tax=Phaeacidiphilus oryzae TaxID=348818 RepID=UPI00056129C6|nr:helix-turn-helix transcriptional regulator [Phaeacidiphilus oryzae]